MNWQPIETAPRDETEILVCCAFDANGNPIRQKDFGLFVQRASWWKDEDGDGEDGEWIVYCSIPCEPALFFEPTHWMPIPKNPGLHD